MDALDKLIEAVEAGTAKISDFIVIPIGEDMLEIFALQSEAYHGSLDAALALHEALLPGWAVNIDILIGRKGPISSDVKLNDDMTIYAGQEKTPARAWLLAVLKAYRSTQQ